jgi:hypothetical protein
MKPERTLNRPRIGQLLVDSGVLQIAPLEEAARIAVESTQPIGRVLLMLGYISEHNLRSGLYAQSLIGQGLLNYENAVKAVALAARANIMLDDALNQLGVDLNAQPDKSELGELLLTSGWVLKPVLDEALKATAEDGTTLGRYLVMKSAISNAHLGTALEALAMVRDEQITFNQAVSLLADMRANRRTFAEALQASKVHVPSTRAKLGDILSMGGLITDAQSLDAVELGLLERQMLGLILTQSGMVSEAALQTALALQSMVSRGLMDKAQAAEVLRQVNARGVTIKQITGEMNLFRGDQSRVNAIVNLLRNTGAVSDSDIAAATGAHPDMDADKALLASGIVDPPLVDAANQCFEMLGREEIKFEQAIMLLQWCQRSRCSLAEAMEELSVSMGGQDEAAQAAAPAKPAVKQAVPAKDNPGSGFGSSEVKQLIGVGALFAASGYAVLAYLPKDMHVYGLWTLLVFLALTLMGLARSWNVKKEQQAADLEKAKQDLEAARRRKTFNR